MKAKQYTIMVVSDDSADYKQRQVSSRLIYGGLSALFAVTIAAVVGVYLSATFTFQGGKMEQLRVENEALRMANDRYHQASVTMEKKLKVFNEKANKLAHLVGIENNNDLAQDGVGGPTLLENELSQYLRPDLGLLIKRTDSLSSQFDELETAFQEKAALLDATPSILPTHGWISSGYQYRHDPFNNKRTFHSGIDISCPEGTPIYAPASGVVSFRGSKSGFGNTLEIKHGNDILTRYGHLYKFNVSKGQRVKRGDVIAYVGNTGRSTAPHLHYEIHKGKKTMNPMNYIVRDKGRR